MDYTINSKEQLQELWTRIYKSDGKPDWSHILPYYDEAIYFRDSIQEIRGIKDFTAMTERLSRRTKSLVMEIKNTAQCDRVIFLEWVMTLRFKRYPNSSIYGISRVTLNDNGRIIEQRDYYDLWGDIFDNVPFFRRLYRFFMRKVFG